MACLRVKSKLASVRVESQFEVTLPKECRFPTIAQWRLQSSTLNWIWSVNGAVGRDQDY